MTRVPHVRFWFSLLIALFLQLVDLPDSLAAARPLCLPLVLMWWTLQESRVPTMVAAFLFGMVLDVLYNCVLGQHAAGFILLVYFMARVRGVFQLFPVWQSTVVLVPAWLAYCALMSLVDDLSRHRADVWLRWLPAASTTLAWPLVCAMLESYIKRGEGE